VTRAAIRLLCVAASVASAGCATTHTRFNALSTQQVPFIGYEFEGARRTPDVVAEVMTQTILWIPTSTASPTLQDAVDAVLKRGGGNVIVDAEVDHWWVFVPFLYGQEGWRVRGDVIQTRNPE
jgi:hypothetical protein